MNRNLVVFSAALALSQFQLAPATAQQAWTQLIANARLTPDEAQGVSLQELAVLHFNRASPRDDDIVLVLRREPVTLDPVSHAQLIAASRLPRTGAEQWTVTRAFAFKIDRDNADDLHLPSSYEPVPVDPVQHAQLIAAAGLSPQEAADLTLRDLAITKSSRSSSDF